MPNLTTGQRISVWYFVISFIMILGINEDVTPIWEMLLLVANLGNAARLVKNVPIPDDDLDE